MTRDSDMKVDKHQLTMSNKLQKLSYIYWHCKRFSNKFLMLTFYCMLSLEKSSSWLQLTMLMTTQLGCVVITVPHRSLVASIRNSPSLPTFRRHLKTHYFQSAYPNP